jgi:phosphatidate cytidylyltransferase
MGALLLAMAGGMLFLDHFFAGWYPFLMAVMLGLALAGCLELLGLLRAIERPAAWFCLAGVAAILLSNWPARLSVFIEGDVWFDRNPWNWVLGTFTLVALSAFLLEIALYREPGGAVLRVALTLLIIAYLGLLPSFLIQLRWGTAATRGAGGFSAVAPLALAIFVPKCCDIGAYFTGRLIGRHPMTPRLSPKKTWEGLAGGLAVAVLTTLVINRLWPVLAGGDMAAVGFGVMVGVAGVLGDLAESLIKRDCRQKDAAQTLPGFGGVLDVIDSILFAAPVAYWWLRYQPAG